MRDITRETGAVCYKVLLKHFRIKTHYAETSCELRDEHLRWTQCWKRHLDSSEAAVWLKLRDEYLSTVENRPVFLERLQLQFPRFKRAELGTIDSYFDSARHCMLKIQTAAENYRRNLGQHFSDTQKVFQKVEEIFKSDEEHTHELEEQAKRTEQRYERLSQLRKSKIQDIKEKERQRLDEERKLALEQQRIAETMQKTRMEKKMAISQFHLQREEERERDRLFMEEQERQSREQRETEAPLRLERISFRQAKAKERQHVLDERARQEAKKRQRREEQLERLAATVSVQMTRQATFLLTVCCSDWERILSETESLRNSNQLVRRPDVRKKFSPVGLSDAKIMSDPRAKLASELQSRGLLQNSYARSMLTRLGKPVAPHLKSVVHLQ